MEKKTWTTLLLALAAAFVISGCGSEKKVEDISETTIGISGKGVITEVSVETFDKSFYSGPEVKAMAEEEVQAYNSSVGGENIRILEFEASGDTAKIKMEYQDYQAYSDYKWETLFAGTVEKANEEGMQLDVLLTDLSENKKISKTDILSMGKRMIVILQEPISVQTSGRITHISDNVEVTGKRTAKVTDVESPAYIIFKK